MMLLIPEIITSSGCLSEQSYKSVQGWKIITLLVDEVDNKEFLTGLFNSMYDELPVLKPKKKK